MKNHIINTLCAWLLPHTCILCGHHAERRLDLCDPCRALLPELTQGCLRCAIPMPMAGLCGQCLMAPPPFAITHALYLYLPPITKLILELKFSQSLVNARVLGELLAEKINNTWYAQKPFPDRIIPMPLHHQRLKERGFNQALELARPIARLLKRPIDIKSVTRTIATRPQAQLSSDERSKNIRGAFTVHRDLTGLHIAVIDDVITTGNTMREFCQQLTRAGAKTIDVWCLARPDKIW